jgi:hypothetical protein
MAQDRCWQAGGGGNPGQNFNTYYVANKTPP